MTRPRISDLRVKPASTREKRTGLRAYVSFLLDGPVRIDGTTVRLTVDGELVLTYPARRDRHGIEHPYVLPVGERVRREIEREVLAALGYDGGRP